MDTILMNPCTLVCNKTKMAASLYEHSLISPRFIFNATHSFISHFPVLFSSSLFRLIP